MPNACCKEHHIIAGKECVNNLLTAFERWVRVNEGEVMKAITFEDSTKHSNQSKTLLWKFRDEKKKVFCE